MNKLLISLAVTTFFVAGWFAAASSSPAQAIEPGVQVYPNNGSYTTSVVREITTQSGRQCVIVQGKNESSITCDWSRK